MTPLRQKMIDAMQVRGLSPKTHRSYLGAVVDLAKYYHRSPDQVSGEELQAFFLYLVKERHLSPATCRLYLNALRFLYIHVLNRDSFGGTGWRRIHSAFPVTYFTQRFYANSPLRIYGQPLSSKQTGANSTIPTGKRYSGTDFIYRI